MTALLDPREGAFFDFSARTKIRIKGADRIRFLKGQLTNDVAKATTSDAIAACVLNAKGRINAHVFLSTHADSFLLDADSELRETLGARLDRYIIADDVQIEDLSDRFSIFHVLSSEAPGWEGNSRIVSVDRFRKSGWDIWVDATQHDQAFEQLSATLSFCDDACAEVFRIEQGIPRWGRELTEEIIPIEANLEESCIDYEKGCYIGQETISRMKMSGQRNKSLCGIVATRGPSLVAGLKLFAVADNSKEVGWITSVARSNRLQCEIALGYVKRGFSLPGSKLDALASNKPFGSPLLRVEIVDLPFRAAAIGID